ncbi:DNA repair protein RecO [Plastoroseomonas arctica]|uniref:DNA repair protein RecO n=1 Tax=Plastoroseomonas arctica TaxID=1509237 RepID=A0AAF1JVA7_9PROT|nr:DNA repair protein RecO [Plastoroseomonas arctica]
MSTEWQAPAIILSARPFGEGGAVVNVITRDHGRHAGLVRGGASRAQSALWQAGNMIEARWIARLADQLGSLSGEMVHPAAALAMEEPLGLALLTSLCAVAEGALPEREPHPVLFEGMIRVVSRLVHGAGQAMADYIRWEAMLLAELGFGIDLASCAVTGAVEDLVFVSPKSGRAVSAAAATGWEARLLPLPAFLRAADDDGAVAAWADGLRLTGHFLERDVFHGHHRAMPEARVRLVERVMA